MPDNLHFTYLDSKSNSCDPSTLLSGIQKEAFEDFISRLNSDVKRIAVAPITLGKSGASVFLVRRVTEQQTLEPIVVKVASETKLIVEERKNYENHIQDKLQYAPILKSADTFALAYEYAKGIFESPTTLREGYSATDTSTLSLIITKLVRTLWRWYGPLVPREITNVESMQFIPSLTERMEQFGDDFSSYLFISDWWDDFKRLRCSVSSNSLYRCHGDLNIGNVMFDKESADPVPLLIDFGSVKEKITYWDFAKLERDLKTRAFLQDALSHNYNIETVINTIRSVDLSQPDRLTNKTMSMPNHKLMDCVATLRKEVINQTGQHLFNQSYFDTLLYCTLITLYRDEPDQKIPINIQRQIACESSAVLLSRILQRPLPPSIKTTIEQKTFFLSEIILKEAAVYEGITHGDFLQLLQEKINNTMYGDIRYAAIAGWEVLKNGGILKSLRDSNDPSKSRTLRVYLIKPGTRAFKEFVRLSNEPEDILIEKIENSKSSLYKLAADPKYSQLRIKLYFYDAIPSVNLLETPGLTLFRSYKIGESQGKFSVITLNKEKDANGLSHMLSNYIRDISHRSEEITIRWF